MKKNILFIIMLLANAQVYAESSFKIRTGAFIPQSTLFRDIYHTAGAIFEAEYAWKFANHWDVWLNFDWFSNKGHSIGLCNRTKVQLANFSVGAKYNVPFCQLWEFYIGAGPAFANIRLKNNSVCCTEKVSKAALGFVIKTGFQRYFCKRYFIDIFTDYIYQRPVGFERNINVGGLRLGAGLGITF